MTAPGPDAGGAPDGGAAIALLPETAQRPIAAALAQFRSEGYARLGPVLGEPALALLRARCDALMQGELGTDFFFQHDSGTGRYDDLPRGLGWQGPSPGYRKIEKLQRDPLFLALITNDYFGRIARAVYSGPVTLYRAVLFNKSAAGGTELPWHQDGGSFWGLSRDPVLQIWTALDDVPPESGCVQLVPRSHAALATPLGGVIPDDVTGPARAAERAIDLPARAGESMLIHNYAWHRSGINATGRPRRALTFCYISAETKCLRRKRAPREFLRVFDAE